jgi:hypothetical protein
MRRVVPLGLLSLAFVAVGLISVLRAADEKPKYTIKQVIKFHKQKLHEKFAKGEASKEEKQKLLDGYEALAKDKPSKGDAASWKKFTETLLKAAKDLEAGKEGAAEAYKKAVSCGPCHTAHRG